MRMDPVDVKGEPRMWLARVLVFWDGEKEVKLPKCACDWNKEEGTITIPLWLAEKHGLKWTA